MSKKQSDIYQLCLAEAQVTGYLCRARGYTLTHLLSEMGMTESEWKIIKKKFSFTYIEKIEGNEYFEKLNKNEEQP